MYESTYLLFEIGDVVDVCQVTMPYDEPDELSIGLNDRTHGRESGGESNMMWFKACRKCHGDLSAVDDKYGTFIFCMQCGRHSTQEEEGALLGFSQELIGSSSTAFPAVRLAA